MYYCKSRYYNSEWSRWLTPDDVGYLNPESINGLNLYCYCLNDPVNYLDEKGHSALLAILIILAVVVIDTVVETSILMGSDKYKANQVYNNGNVKIPNSVAFNNPIAQLIYSFIILV